MITFTNNFLKNISLIIVISLMLQASVAFAQVVVEKTAIDTPVVGISISAGGEQTWEYTIPVEEMTLSFDPESVSSSFSLDVLILSKKFDGGNFILNGNAKNAILESKKFPEIRFSSENITLGALEQGVMETEVTGMLTLHGVEREIVLPLELELEGTNLAIKSAFSILTTDYDMKILEGFGFKLDDQINLSLDLLVDLSDLL